MGTSTQQTLNELFLKDTYEKLKAGDFDAVECVAHLRLYIAVSGYGQSLRELYMAGGFTSAQYDALLCKYNKQLAKSIK